MGLVVVVTVGSELIVSFVISLDRVRTALVSVSVRADISVRYVILGLIVLVDCPQLISFRVPTRMGLLWAKLLSLWS